MKPRDVTMAHIYLTEGDKRLNDILARLHDEQKVSGVTVLRGITGFGKHGHIHSSSLIDMSLDLPLVVEFFDTADKIAAVIDSLSDIIEPGHVTSWPATLYE